MFAIENVPFTIGTRPCWFNVSRNRMVPFWTVVVPISRPVIMAGFLLVFVFTLGSYLIAALLGRPEHWTLSVFISDQASFNANVPFASAMAIFLTTLSLVVVGVVALIESRTRRVA